VTATFSLAAPMYQLGRIDETARAFAHLCTVRLLESTLTAIVVEVDAPNDGAVSFDRLASEVLNYLLDASLETHLGAL
jgi:hypothetical protein